MEEEHTQHAANTYDQENHPQPRTDHQSAETLTHVVHLPTNQINRINNPPSSNPNSSSISETRHHHGHGHVHDHDDDQTACSKTSLSYFFTGWCFFLVVIIALILLIIVSIFYLALKPKSPKFFIQSFIQHRDSHNVKYYEVSIKARNPNPHMGIFYQQGGAASLLYGQQNFANGEAPAFYHGKMNSKIFQLKLITSNTASEVVKRVQESMETGDPNMQILLTLSINVPVKVELWSMKTWKLKMIITCQFRVLSSLAKDSHILSQKCSNKVHL